ncbi:MAG TPA: hypothetical protein VMR19_02130 [Candidatus Saccharimonadales bacterium]|jgi:hypothetical protein|nr:hypothetical protein [Candidatus Saccharimonadales bacterium]
MSPELDRYKKVIKSVYKGITSPADDNFKKIVDTRPPPFEHIKYNPLPEEILPEIIQSLESEQNIKLSGLKSDLGISRSEIMILYASFTDHHDIDRVGVFRPYVEGAMSLINIIEKMFRESEIPMGISEQLEMAMGISEGDISPAVISLSLATRMIARNSDFRILGTRLSDESVYSLKRAFAPFGYGRGLEDATGDTYHFWFGTLAGISREENLDVGIVNSAKQLVCDVIYPYTAQASEILRHKLYLGMPTWNTHETVDRVGYQIGRALVNIYRSHNHIDSSASPE